jgi:hypothetical protein
MGYYQTKPFNMHYMQSVLIKNTCLFIVVSFVTILHYSANAQDKDYAYLLQCFNHPTDTLKEVEIKGMGTVDMYSFEADSLVETGVTCYNIPGSKSSKPKEKLAEIAANLQISTWKNNSRIAYYKKWATADAAFVDVRLHLLIEDIYFQVVIIVNKGKVYEVDCFRDTNETKTFDGITASLNKMECIK